MRINDQTLTNNRLFWLHPNLADLFCSASILLARYMTQVRRECKAHASRTHYLFHLGDAPFILEAYLIKRQANNKSCPYTNFTGKGNLPAM